MNPEFFWTMVKNEVARQQTSFEWLYGKTKIPKGTFSSWKNRNIMPRADAAYRIAEALNVSLEYLLTGSDRMGRPSNPKIQEIIDKLSRFDDVDLQSLYELVKAMGSRY
jgi:transcriptional regulator with XRE-family HTH domain